MLYIYLAPEALNLRHLRIGMAWWMGKPYPRKTWLERLRDITRLRVGW